MRENLGAIENFLDTTIEWKHKKIILHQKQLGWNIEQRKHCAPKAVRLEHWTTKALCTKSSSVGTLNNESIVHQKQFGWNIEQRKNCAPKALNTLANTKHWNASKVNKKVQGLKCNQKQIYSNSKHKNIKNTT
jgi:hypothetical protein